MKRFGRKVFVQKPGGTIKFECPVHQTLSRRYRCGACGRGSVYAKLSSTCKTCKAKVTHVTIRQNNFNWGAF